MTLRAAGGYLLLVSLVYAPWALGCVKPGAVTWLAVIAFAAVLLWGVGLMISGRAAAIPRVTAWCVGLLLAQGWWMIFNAHGEYNGSLIVPVESLWLGGPGAVDGPVCMMMMVQITAVLALFVVACDLASENKWRWRIIATIGGTAFSIAAWGLLEKTGMLPQLAERIYADSVFATFDYHGNAGAYLNLGIPAVFALAIYFHRAGGAAATLICLAAALVNVSRAGAAIAILIAIVLVGWSRVARPVLAAKQSRRMAAVMLAAFVAIVVAAGSAALKRWNSLENQGVGSNPRWIMLKVAVPMAYDSGFFGDGPGSFKLTYPNTRHMKRALYPVWKVEHYQVGEETSIYSYAHNDYVQFKIEWGWIGAALWGTLIVSGIVLGRRAYARGNYERRLIVAISLTALVGVLLHSLVDWPLQVASIQLYATMYLALLFSCASS
jgi:O-antigen ligase